MRMMNLASTRKQIDRAATPGDVAIGALAVEVASIASDSSAEGREGEAHTVLAEIAPIKLGRKVYRVVHTHEYTFESRGVMVTRREWTLAGPRGGVVFLAPHSKPGVYRSYSLTTRGDTWWQSTDGVTFTAL